MKICNQCQKEYDDSWEVCLKCASKLSAIELPEIPETPSITQSANTKPSPPAEKQIIDNFKAKPLPIKWVLVTWSLMWRAVLIPFAGLWCFSRVVAVVVALVGGDAQSWWLTWDSWEAPARWMLSFFLYEWAANVICRKQYGIECLRFAGWSLLWRFELVFWITGLAFINTALMNVLDVYFRMGICIIFSIPAMLYFSRRRFETLQQNAGENQSETPGYLMRKALIFIPGLYFVMVIIIALSFTVGGGIILLMLMSPRIPVGIMLLLGLGIGITFFAVMSAVFKIMFPKPSSAFARIVDINQNPKFKSMLEDLSRQTKTPMPQHVVIDAQSDFSVQQNKIKTNDGKILSGKILTISAGLMRFLSIDELRAILAHEFGHFAGKDTTFSKVVQPVYSGSLEAINAMGSGFLDESSDGMNWMALPNILPKTILTKYVESFHAINMRISRAREFRSDLIAANVVGKKAFEDGLDKVTIVSQIFNEALSNKDKFMGDFDYNSDNLYISFKTYLNARPDLLEETRTNVRAEELSRGDNPYDSHPSFKSRIKNISECKIGDLNNTPAIELFDDPEPWERLLTDDIKKILNLIEAKQNARYKVVIKNTKSMRKNKEFKSIIKQLTEKSDDDVEAQYFDKKSTTDSLVMGDLIEEQALKIIEIIKPHVKDSKLEVKVENDAPVNSDESNEDDNNQ